MPRHGDGRGQGAADYAVGSGRRIRDAAVDLGVNAKTLGSLVAVAELVEACHDRSRLHSPVGWRMPAGLTDEFLGRAATARDVPPLAARCRELARPMS